MIILDPFIKTVWRLMRTEDFGIQQLAHSLVDSEEEWLLLEELIHSKASQDPLFTYPPLQYASRFGTQLETSVWYGSLEIKTALAEKAFYQFQFLRAGNINTNLLLYEAFSQLITTKKGIDLTQTPFITYRHVISSPVEYKQAQALGNAMRQDGIEAFCFYSARSIEDEVNVGAFVPKIFQKVKESYSTIWQCSANETSIEFVNLSDHHKQKLNFPLERFLIEKSLPFPAG